LSPWKAVVIPKQFEHMWGPVKDAERGILGDQELEMGATCLSHDAIEVQLVPWTELCAWYTSWVVGLAILMERSALRALVVEVVALTDLKRICAIEEEEDGV
jgi:hypothetical protein